MELVLGHRTLVMGIVNVTPDSFYDGGRYDDIDRACAHAGRLLSEGADIVDVGGASTRPGAEEVNAPEELRRISPVIERITCENPGAFVSVDTWKSEVAEGALRAGARMVNDISGLRGDSAMADVCARHDAYVVLMHMRGTPKTMQNDLVYDDLIGEVSALLEESAQRALAAGVRRERIILDPGIGFGKSLEQNYSLIKNISVFKTIGYPLLIGLSRKSLIGHIIPEGEDRLPATIALDAVSTMNGADIIRVHDVKAHVLALGAVEMLKKVSA
jgi:dihydropteroate synthase